MKKQKILLVMVFTIVSMVSVAAMTQAYAQSTSDGLDGYVRGTSGIYTGNQHECWYPGEDGNMLPCRIDTGDTAWMLTATSLVLLMSPGVAVFYGGLARSKNAVNVFGMVLIIMGIAAVQWLLFGYSLAFGPNYESGNAFMGALDYVGFNNVSHYAPLGSVGNCNDTTSAAYQMNQMVDADQCSQDWPGTIPHMLFAIFQGTFAIITPILIIGAVVDRMKLSAVLIFVVVWSTFVYYPVAHWIWGGGFMADGTLDLDPSLSPSFVLDFAGGAVVHITAGFAALAAALVLGRRMGLGKLPMEPHNVPMVVLGAGILWFGWFGFNPGSEVMVDGITVSAWMATNIAAGMGTVTWVLLSWAHTGKPSIVGAATGTIAGLGTITPASGWVGPMGALIIGIAAGAVCYGAVAFKNARKWDDALDVWGVHGMGGLTGTILVGTLASPHIWDTGDGIGAWTGTAEGMEQQSIQIIGAAITVGYTLAVTFGILKVMDLIWPGGIRVTPRAEEIGLDLAQHGERAYVNE